MSMLLQIINLSVANNNTSETLPISEQQDISNSLRHLRDLATLRTLDLEVVVDDVRYFYLIFSRKWILIFF